MPGTREIKRRIRSVGSTKKITRAMQTVSAVKMRKAQQAALASRKYSELASQIVENLSHRVDPKYHRLLSENAHSKKIGIILITTNRGLVGAFNANLINGVNKYVAKHSSEAEIAAELVTVGRKGRDAMARIGNVIVADFQKIDRTARLEEIFPIAKTIVDEYLSGKYKKIVVAYTHFISTIKQQPVMKEILPFKKPRDMEALPEHHKNFNYEYLFEPNPEQVLDYLLPRVIESQIYQAVLESDASEHSSRMVMMKNATDAATDLIDELTLSYNQLRQANITKELAEIISGMRK